MAAPHCNVVGELMDADLTRAWHRGAVALAVPGACLLLLALACVRGATSRALWNSRAAGVVTDLNCSKNRGSHPTIEYSAGGKTYQFQTAWNYSAQTFAVGQKVTVLYPPNRPQFGMLDSFSELWPLPIVLLVVSLVLLGLAWRAKTGLPPILHGVCSVGLTVFGGLLGMTLFSLLCIPGGFDVLAGAPLLVSLFGGMLLFFATVPVTALGTFALWNCYIPARCPRCSGGMRGKFVGKQLVYTCTSCGHHQ